MQAIARVNRVFRDKEGGLVVDYVGIAAALKQAMNDYTVRDKKNYGDPDVGKAAYPKFQEKLEVCRDLFHGFDYTRFLTGDEHGKGPDDQRRRQLPAGSNPWQNAACPTAKRRRTSTSRKRFCFGRPFPCAAAWWMRGPGLKRPILRRCGPCWCGSQSAAQARNLRCRRSTSASTNC